MKLEDLLHFETDDSCAICGNRGINILTIHHIDGDHNNNVYDNTILLCHNCHHKYHQNRGLSLDDIKKRKENRDIFRRLN